MIKNILFDMDGTLLPMDQEEFTMEYMSLLSHSFAKLGYEPKKLVDAVWHGFAKMVKNTSDKTNEDVFYEYFRSVYGDETDILKPLFDDFYRNEFQQVKRVCGLEPGAKKAVNCFKAAGLRVIVATLPAFPREAIYSRVRWAGLTPSDFSYITTFENSTRCKPNPEYYSEIISKLELDPGECLMVGNNVDEDMIASSVGMDVFLMPKCLINDNNKDITVYPQGGFDELISYVMN